MKQHTFAKSLYTAFIPVLVAIMTIGSTGMIPASRAGRSRSLLENCTPAAGVVIQPPYASGYSACELGNFTGLPSGIGAITFKHDDPNTLLVAAYTETSTGVIYAVPVDRDAGNHIINIANTGTLFARAPFVSTGMAYGPGNVLFYSRWPANEIGEIKPGSVETDRVIALSSLGVTPAVSGINFVPDDFPHAGELKLVTYQKSDWYAAALSPEADGTYSISAVSNKAKISMYPEAFAYVPPSSPQFADYTAMLVTEYYNGAISAYTLDSESNPVPTSRSAFLSGLSWVKGSALDPLTGDLIVATRGARAISVRGFGTQPWVPTPTPTATPTPAATYTISGRIISTTGYGISGVDIYVDGEYYGSTPDDGRLHDGSYTVRGLAAGTHKISVQVYNFAFQPSEYTVTVPPDAVVNFTGERRLGPTPIIIVHGWKGMPGDASDKCKYGIERHNSDGWFDDLPHWLTRDGFNIWIAHWDSGPDWTATLEDNAKCIGNAIAAVRQITGHKKVILIAHSMGGPVSRAYLQSDEYKKRQDVQTLITFGSPHAGIGGLHLLLPLLTMTPLGLYCLWQPAFCQMEPLYMALFNERNENNTVEYHFFGGDGGGGPIGWALPPFDGPNDGLVGTASATGMNFSWSGNTNAFPHPVTRYLTDEDHLREWGTWYFEPSTGETVSDAYKCLRQILLGLDKVDCQAAPTPLAPASVQEQETVSALAPVESGHISTGESVNRTLSIDTPDRSVFTLSWMTGTLSLALVDPKGVTIDPAYAMANPSIVTYDSGPAGDGSPGWMSYTFPNTVPGDWTLSVSAPDAGPDGTGWVALAGFLSDRTLEVGIDKNFYSIGDTATLTATLTNGTAGIPGANVSVELTRPDNITDTLVLADMGGGHYQGTYNIPDAPGYAEAIVTANGSDGGTAFSRQSRQVFSIMPQTGQLTGSYADRAVDENGNGWADALEVDMGFDITKAGDYNLTADLQAGDQVVAQFNKVFSVTAGSQTMTLRFDGSEIYNAGLDGPYRLTNLVLVDLQAAVPSIMQSDLYTTEAYKVAQFMPVSPLYLPAIIR